MTPHCFAAVAASVLIACGTAPAVAQDARGAVVERIASAQGLADMFDQQLAQQREMARGYATKLLDESVVAGGGQVGAREKAALERFIARSADIFSGKEFVSVWVQHYGSDLSMQDLQAILAYYESPAGRKDVAATRKAMVAFTSWMGQEAELRMTALLKDFMAELEGMRQ